MYLLTWVGTFSNNPGIRWSGSAGHEINLLMHLNLQCLGQFGCNSNTVNMLFIVRLADFNNFKQICFYIEPSAFNILDHLLVVNSNYIL